VQTACTQCQQKIVIDEAKVPDKPFAVKCPKCGTVLKLPGRVAENGPVAAEAAAPPASPPPDPHGYAIEEAPKVPTVESLRNEPAAEGPAGRALVALPDRSHAAAVTQALVRLGYGVDTAEELEDPVRLLDQGLYGLVATNRQVSTVPGRETLYQRIGRLNPDGRRRLFLVLVGEEFKSGSAVQAFALLADLVLHPADFGRAHLLVSSTAAERERLYQPFFDAQKHLERME
jgi:predicted Zn finger-like uncharacterized protein